MVQRIIVAAVGIPFLLFVFCVCPPWATALFLLALCVVGAYELSRAILPWEKVKKTFAMTAALSCLTVSAPYWQNDTKTLLCVIPWLYAMLLLLVFGYMVAEYGKADALSFYDVCAILMAGIVIPLALSCLLRLRLLNYGGGMVLIPSVAAFCSDSAALFGGMFFGQRKLAPLVSPKKTVEGAVSGLAGGMLGMILFRIVFFLVTEVPLHIGWCMLMGLVGSAVGQLGDLAFSCIKRERGIKDYSRLLPGHGGVLDRFDSVIFAAPVLWLIVSRAAFY